MIYVRHMGVAEALCRKLERFSGALKNGGFNDTSKAPKPDTALQLARKESQKTPVKK